MALSERFDKQTRINEVEGVSCGEPERVDQICRSGAVSRLHASSGNMYDTDTEGAFSSCFSFLFMNSETVE